MTGPSDIGAFPGPDFIGRELFQRHCINCRDPSLPSAVAIVVPGPGLGHCPDFRNDETQATRVIIEGLVCQVAFVAGGRQEIADARSRRLDWTLRWPPRRARILAAVFGVKR